MLEVQGYIWFSKNLRQSGKERTYRGKVEGNEKWSKIKIGFKINKLFLYAISNSFHLF